MFNQERVLIAQGSDALRRKLYSALLQRDVFSDTVSDGPSAIEQISGRTYALVLLDLSLPPAGATDVLDRLRQLPREQRPVVVAMRATEQLQQPIDIELVQVVLRKPYNSTHIADIVESCLRAMEARTRRRQVEASEASREAARAKRAG